MGVIDRLGIIIENEDLPSVPPLFPSPEVQVQRLRGTADQGCIENSVLPAVEGGDGILLKRVSVQTTTPVSWISA